MVIEQGEKAHVVYRRTIDGEVRRHFVDEIKEVQGVSTRLVGYVFIFDTSKNQFIKKPELRTIIINLAESGYIVNMLPASVVIDDLKYNINEQKRLVISDNQGFSLDINEFGLGC